MSPSLILSSSSGYPGINFGAFLAFFGFFCAFWGGVSGKFSKNRGVKKIWWIFFGFFAHFVVVFTNIIPDRLLKSSGLEYQSIEPYASG